MNKLISVIIFSGILIFSIQSQNPTQEGYQYLSPLPEARHVAPQAMIIIRFNDFTPDKLVNLNQLIKVSGSINGEYSGKTKIASDNRTIIFDPHFEYISGEIITITVHPETGDETIAAPPKITYNFEVSNTKPSVYSKSDPPAFITGI